MNEPGMEPYLTVFEEGRDAVLAPDVLLPAQYFARIRSVTKSRERLLWVRVLEDAADCWIRFHRSGNARHERLAIDAGRWINGTHESRFSFVDVCEMLGIDPDYLRRGIFSRPGPLPRRTNDAYGAANQKIEIVTGRSHTKEKW